MALAADSPEHGYGLFDVGTELGRDLAGLDWAATAFGPVPNWSASLRNVVTLMLGSRFAMWMAWGPDLTFLCNEAYRRDTLGAKYPWALGRRADEVWAEIWPDIGPRIESVITTGVATWDEGLMLFLRRSGYDEETYHTFSYSPVSDDNGQISGMLCVVSEETARVIGERRMATLRDFGAALAAASTEAEVHAAAARQLRDDAHDLPFVMAYLFDDDLDTARLAWTANISQGHAAAPALLTVGGRDTGGWPTAAAVTGTSELVDDLPDRFAGLPSGAWSIPPRTALAVPLNSPGSQRPDGLLIAALNPHRHLDGDYRSFVELLATQLAAALARARAFEQERRRASDLAELDRAKTTFFTNVSHELRTPLTLLLGPLDDALDDVADPLSAAQRTRAEMVRRNAQRLLKLVNTLLDFSRMESGQVTGLFEPLDLARYTAELVAMFESTAARAGLTLEFSADDELPQTFLDREMWAKIVLNLVSNAVKATFTGGITVRLVDGDGAVELAVGDTGVGISEAEQSRLFERFHRVSGAPLRSHEGSGIGLALVAELVAVHGGSVGVRSTPGVGSTFTVRVPYGDDHLPADQVVRDASSGTPAAGRFGSGYVAEANRWFDDLSAQETRAQAEPAAGHRRRVLVADDNADMREYISRLLRDDYEVTTARDGLDALDLATAAPPDLVLTDVMMPGLDGFGLLTELRGRPETMHVPVVMLSARSGDDAAVAGLEAGADDYLVKPFAARELLARVKANLELDRVRRVADELARSRELLDQAEELAHVGSWEIDLHTDSVTGSAEYFRILGTPQDHSHGGGLQDALQSVQDEDRHRLREALDRAALDGTAIDEELRLHLPSGGQRLVHARGLVQRDESGTPSAIRGSVQDITDRRRAELAQAGAAAEREAAAREHAIAEELQRSLLPAIPFDPRRIAVAAYYKAGVEGTQAGGDWYDVIDLASGRTALVLGDVMGRGVRAAAVMGQLRATVRAYARLELDPAQLLQLLDAAVADISRHTIVTCVYAVYDPLERTLTYGNAGHLPPLLTQQGVTRQLGVGDPPLGTGLYSGRVETITVDDRAVLMLYTDGLVEHRGRDIDTGIDLLTAGLTGLDVPLEAIPSLLVDLLLPHEPDDDIAILVAELGEPGPADLVVHTAVEPRTDAVAAAREAAARACRVWELDSAAAFDVALVVSELVTNAVRHGQGPIEMLIRRSADRVLVDVADSGSGKPRRTDAEPSAPSGRGLAIIDAVSSSWGIRSTGRGKAVWSLLSAPAAAPADVEASVEGT